MCGRAERVIRSVRTEWLQSRGQIPRSAFSPRNGNRSMYRPQTLRPALRAAHIREPGTSVHAHRCRCTSGCLTSPPWVAASGRDLRVHATQAPRSPRKNSANRWRTRTAASSPRFCLDPAGRDLRARVGSFVIQPTPVGSIIAHSPKARGTNCLGAAQLGVAPDRAPSLGPVLNAPRAFWLACVSG